MGNPFGWEPCPCNMPGVKYVTIDVPGISKPVCFKFTFQVKVWFFHVTATQHVKLV